MRGIGNGRKVRCHKEAVENPLARLATGYDCTWKLKMVRTHLAQRLTALLMRRLWPNRKGSGNSCEGGFGG
jgi:hypothetical protein